MAHEDQSKSSSTRAGLDSSPRAVDVLVREVGMRDGLQIVAPLMSTADKLHWIGKASAAGLREMEVTSFVPPSYLPQFVDAEDVARFAARADGLVSMAFAPNVKGAERALSSGIHKIAYGLSATESFNQANLRRSVAASLDGLKQVVRLRAQLGLQNRVRIVGALSCAFGCPFEGRVPEAVVLHLAGRMVAAGADEIALADTVGYGDPALVGRIFRAATRDFGSPPISAHFHDTRGTGLANVVAALESGVRVFDASIGGLGGCPNTPRSAGNVATEDLVFMLESMGLRTGIDIQALFDIRNFIAERLPGVLMYGRVAQAGVPKGFVAASAENS